MFKISDKVVCIGIVMPHENYHHGNIPERKKVYVIEKIIGADKKARIGLALVGGYTSYWATTGSEVGYGSEGFIHLEEMQRKNSQNR